MADGQPPKGRQFGVSGCRRRQEELFGHGAVPGGEISRDGERERGHASHAQHSRSAGVGEMDLSNLWMEEENLSGRRLWARKSLDNDIDFSLSLSVVVRPNLIGFVVSLYYTRSTNDSHMTLPDAASYQSPSLSFLPFILFFLLRLLTAAMLEQAIKDVIL